MPKEQLTAFLQNLAQIRPQQSNWRSIETWIAGFRPFIRAYFRDNLSDFERIAKAPEWLCLTSTSGTVRDEFQEDNDPAHETSLTPQARPNVLFEAGMAFGRHSDRPIMVQIGRLRPFSDVAGKHSIQFTGTAEHRSDLRERLRTSGCAVTKGGTDWLRAGIFDEALRLATPAPLGKQQG